MNSNGYELIPDFLSAVELTALRVLTDEVKPRAGLRNLLTWPEIAALASSPSVRSVVGPGAFAVRGILFDKTPENNWKVPWHQDLSIAVAAQVDVEGYGPWSVKAGVVHVQPPLAVLEQMLTLRLHLDDCGPDNGPLRVKPGTHLLGKRPEVPAVPEVVCTLPAGGALLMRPLLFHASSPTTAPGRRRVIHLEFASQALPGGLEWATG